MSVEKDNISLTITTDADIKEHIISLKFRKKNLQKTSINLLYYNII